MQKKHFLFGTMFLGFTLLISGCGNSPEKNDAPVKRIITSTTETSSTNTREDKQISHKNNDNPAFSTCFENIGLKDTTKIEMNLVEPVAVGMVTVTNDDARSIKTYPFTGEIKNNKIKVTFAQNIIPDIFQKNPASLALTIVAEKGIEKLNVELYGEDYETKKYSSYTATFDSCGSSQEADVKTEPKNVIVTLENKEKKISLNIGDTMLLKFGNENFDWNITVEDQKIIDRVKNVMVMSDAQGLYKAAAKGNTNFIVKGEPKCFKTAPQCALAPVSFKVNVEVK